MDAVLRTELRAGLEERFPLPVLLQLLELYVETAWAGLGQGTLMVGGWEG